MDDHPSPPPDIPPELQRRIVDKSRALFDELRQLRDINARFPARDRQDEGQLIVTFLVTRLAGLAVAHDLMSASMDQTLQRVVGTCAALDLLVQKLEAGGVIRRKGEDPLCH